MANVRRIHGSYLIEEGRWDPHLFCGPAALVIQQSGKRPTLKTMGADCVEGLRDLYSGSSHEISGPTYQVGNLEPLRFRLDRDHWTAPTNDNYSARIEPGDVVVSKTAPVTAAWAPRGLPRHPANVGCIVIKWKHAPAEYTGLENFAVARERQTLTAEFWVALCLNQPEYGELLLRRSGATILPRISVSALRELKVPTPPPEAEALAMRIWEWNEHAVENAKELTWLLNEVDENIQPFLPDSDELVAAHRLSTGRFFPAADVIDSLIPRHVVQGHLQHTLRDQRGWLSLPELLAPRQPSRRRQTEVDSRDLYLRLSDIGDDMTIPGTSRTTADPMPGRTFAEPIASDEVMLSLLVTSPRVAFAGAMPGREVFAVDHWERLCFRETPGAWALVLATESTRRQLGLMAMGSIQQFTHSESLSGLMLPPLDEELRRKWDRQLRRYQVRQQKLRQNWQELWEEALALYRQVHPGVAQRVRDHDARRL